MHNILKKYHKYDLIIIGSGGSGLTAAIYAARRGLKIAVISKVHPMNSHTVAAQGGINAALGNVTPDNWQWHAYDTIKASDWLADEDSVEIMCSNAADAIKMLNDIGVQFNRTNNGLIDQKIYGGQSTNYGKGELAYRACYSDDRTGSSIMAKLYDIAKNLDNIDFLNYNFVLELIMSDNKCCGVVSWDIEQGVINIIHGVHTIIATGGYSQIYETSTSSPICTGDGNGLAVKASINLQDMEFIQFHPTAINKFGVLVTEASRSVGGVLLNRNNQRFMAKYAPKFMELASRDIVARAIANEIALGQGCGEDKDHVLLDLTHLTTEYIKNNLPTVFENCQFFLKIDPSKSPIPIAPAAHYTMGGIPTNKFCQVIKFDKKDIIVDGLYAIGEAASISVHGAGRLGCNSLLDLIVFGKIVVENIVNNQTKLQKNLDRRIEESIINRFFGHFEREQKEIGALKVELKLLMQKNVGVFRSKNNLIDIIKSFDNIKQIYNNSGIRDKSLLWNVKLQEYLELGNMIISAEATIYSAMWRQESRGSHFRNDYPNRDDNNFLCHTIYLNNRKECVSRSVRKSEENKELFQLASRSY
ncbi:MAG: FAD-dependent oxidoreductase [Rickettsia endosymbiont of Bryobia graminum]|nr:FAD-dependent oxidoreductase [Rickettsia endosymbiont of Bryobia graminum]